MRAQLILSLFFAASLLLHSQISSGDSGIEFVSDDNSYKIKMGLAVQPRISGKADVDQFSSVESTPEIRRLRLKFDGFILDPSVTYFVQLGLSNQDMESVGSESDHPSTLFDAYIQWEFAEGNSLWFGQGKLPGDLSRQMSFTSLNFLERSAAAGYYTTYRDIGFQYINKFSIGDWHFRERLAVTHGEGRNRKTKSGAFCYTGRVEVLPLGEFTKGGEYCEPDIQNEKSPKIMIGAAASYNDDAHLTRSTLGSEMIETKDILTVFGDVIIKYRGISFITELYKRSTKDPVSVSEDLSEISICEVGTGFATQVSYFYDTYSVAFRYSNIMPDDEIIKSIDFRNDYTLGIAKYLKGNKFKLQMDLNYSEAQKELQVRRRALEARFQVIFSI